MNKKEIHAYLDDVLDEAYARGNREGYQQGRADGYRCGQASVILPHPCDGPLYDDWTPEEHLAKVAEEYDEVLKAFAEFRGSGKLADRFKFFNECTDLQVAIVSMMDRFGCHEAGRQRRMYEVNESNAQRDHGQRFKKEGWTVKEKHLANLGEIEEAEQSNKERFKDGDKVKIIIPESEIRGELDVRKVQDMIITNNSMGRVIYYDTSLDTYALEVAGRIVGVPSEWLKKVEEV